MKYQAQPSRRPGANAACGHCGVIGASISWQTPPFAHAGAHQAKVCTSAWGLGAGERGLSASVEPSVVAFKHRKAAVVGAQTQHPARGLEHHLLQHRLDAPALGAVTQRPVRLIERVLANQAQQVHRHCSERAHQVVGIKLARGQPLQIHVGLELRVLTWGFAKLLMRGVRAIQRNHLFGRETAGQRSGPAFQHEFGQQQGVAMAVNGALGQTKDAPRRVGRTAHASQTKRGSPQAFALAGACAMPRRAGVGRLVRGDALHRRATRVPLDDESDLARERGGLGCDVAVGRARANWKLRVDQRAELDGLEVFAHQRQSGVEAGVVGQFLDNEVGHVRVHLRDEPQMRTKSLISKEKMTELDQQVTDSGDS